MDLGGLQAPFRARGRGYGKSSLAPSRLAQLAAAFFPQAVLAIRQGALSFRPRLTAL